jgi:hypothetical protein
MRADRQVRVNRPRLRRMREGEVAVPAYEAYSEGRTGFAGIEKVFGSEPTVQRCRNHKMRNVLDELPREHTPRR